MDLAQNLFVAVTKNDVAGIKSCLEMQCNPDTLDNCMGTPLMRAAKNGNEEVVDLLLNAQADANMKNDWEQTPLMFAAMYGQEAIVKMLLARGANVHAVSKLGRTARMLAELANHTEVAQYLAQRELSTANDSVVTADARVKPFEDSVKKAELSVLEKSISQDIQRAKRSPEFQALNGSALFVPISIDSPNDTFRLRRENEDAANENAALQKQLQEERLARANLEGKVESLEKKIQQLEEQLQNALLHGGFAL